MSEITQQGITQKTLQQYLSDIKQALLDIDPDWNIDPESPDGLKSAIDAEMFANLDEQLVKAYQSIDPFSAAGQALFRIGAISGTVRKEATFSTADLQFTGTNGVVIPQGTEVLNVVTDTVWATNNDVTIAGGTALVNATCQTSGAEPADVGDLSSISSPIGGVTSVTNPSAASIGADEESEEAFRIRRNNSVAKPGNNLVDSMFAEVASVDGVKHVKIIENFEDIADANGVEPHSLAVFVDGGSNADVAAAMAASKAPGAGLNANNSYQNKVQTQTNTPGGNEFVATFYRPVLSTIYIDVSVSGSPDVDALKQAIVDYAAGTLFDSEGLGFDRSGFGIGEVVAAGKLFTPANSIVGSSGYVTSILIGDDALDINYGTVDPGFNGLGVFDVNNITVTSI